MKVSDIFSKSVISFRKKNHQPGQQIPLTWHSIEILIGSSSRIIISWLSYYIHSLKPTVCTSKSAGPQKDVFIWTHHPFQVLLVLLVSGSVIPLLYNWGILWCFRMSSPNIVHMRRRQNLLYIELSIVCFWRVIEFFLRGTIWFYCVSCMTFPGVHLQGRSGDPTAVGGKAARQPWKFKEGHENHGDFFWGKDFFPKPKKPVFYVVKCI